MYVKDSINYTGVVVEKGEIKIELQIINLHLDKFPLTLVNIYSRDWNSEVVNKLKSLLAREHKDYIITGDFNAHYTAWGSSGTDSWGGYLGLCSRNSKVLLNDGSPTRVGQVLTCLDLTIDSPKISVLSDWGVMEDTWGSDHFPIMVYRKLLVNPETKLNFKKADWEKFNSLCEGISPEEVY